MVSDFLELFVFSGTSAKKGDQIDLKLTLKALPARIDDTNVNRVILFDFRIIQNSLIAFQNANQDQLFAYYDNRNKTRLRKLREKATVTQQQTEDLRILASSVLSILQKIAHFGQQGSLKKQHTKKVEQLLITKKDIEKAFSPQQHQSNG